MLSEQSVKAAYFFLERWSSSAGKLLKLKMEFGQSFLQSRRRLCPSLAFIAMRFKSIIGNLREFAESLWELFIFLRDNGLETRRNFFERRHIFLHFSTMSLWALEFTGWNTEIWCSMKGKSDRTIGRWTDDSGEMMRVYVIVVAPIPSASPLLFANIVLNHRAFCAEFS